LKKKVAGIGRIHGISPNTGAVTVSLQENTPCAAEVPIFILFQLLSQPFEKKFHFFPSVPVKLNR
jgi:hypothetical protein